MSVTFTTTDRMNSILQTFSVKKGRQQPWNYAVYGNTAQWSQKRYIGFNGERLDPFTGLTHLGNGYRSYNASLMRFQAPDNWSPFGKGGMNSYAYCSGDPVNYSDPSGHMNQKDTASIVLGTIGLVLGFVTASISLSASRSLKATKHAVHRAGSDLNAGLTGTEGGVGSLFHHNSVSHHVGHKKVMGLTAPIVDIIASGTGIAGAVAHDNGEQVAARGMGVMSLSAFVLSAGMGGLELRKLIKQKKKWLSADMAVLTISMIAGTTHEAIALDDYFSERAENETENSESSLYRTNVTHSGPEYFVPYTLNNNRMLVINQISYTQSQDSFLSSVGLNPQQQENEQISF